MSAEIPGDAVLREATINLVELYIVYVFSAYSSKLLTSVQYPPESLK
jgi:hypothetical protein